METAHHILVYGCTKPGSSKPVWNCGEMANAARKSLDTAPACQEGTQVMNINVKTSYTIFLEIREEKVHLFI